MAWWLVPALVKFRQQVNERYPNRDKTSDGTIGDARHSASASEHNPDPDGSVDAWDIDVDGIIVGEILYAATHDERTAHIIYNGQIWTHQTGWRQYSGSNKHNKHIHIAVRSAYQMQTHPWVFGPVTSNPTPPNVKIEDEDMLLLRNIETNGVVLIVGDKVVPVAGTEGGVKGHNDYASLQLAVKTAGVSNLQFTNTLNALNAPENVRVLAEKSAT